MNKQDYTSDSNIWWNVEHGFASVITTHLINATNAKAGTHADKMCEDLYTWALEYARGLDQGPFIELLKECTPELVDSLKARDWEGEQ